MKSLQAIDQQHVAGHVATLKLKNTADGKILESLTGMGLSKGDAQLALADFEATRTRDQREDWFRAFHYVMTWVFLAILVGLVSFIIGYGVEFWFPAVALAGAVIAFIRMRKVQRNDF